MADAQHPARAVDPEQQVHACKALRAFFRIAAAWRLTTAQQDGLLGISSAMGDAWRHDPRAAGLSVDTLQRLGHVLEIYAGLQTLLPIRERADAWVRLPSTAPLFQGRSALEHMLSGGTADLNDVAQYVRTSGGVRFV